MSDAAAPADGYTLKGKIPAQNQWPEVNITYRPAVWEKADEWFRSMAGSKNRGDNLAKLLTDQLLSWDRRDKPDDTATILCTPENWRKQPHHIIEKIIDLVTGYAMPDTSEGTGKNA